MLKEEKEWEHINFIIQQIDFYCSMCNDRNYTWKKFFSKDFKFDQLIKSIDYPMIPEIKASVLKLLKTLYIDQEPRQKIDVPIICKTVEVQMICKFS